MADESADYSLPVSDEAWKIMQGLACAREMGDGWADLPPWGITYDHRPLVWLGLIEARGQQVRLTNFGLAMLGDGLERVDE